MELALMVTATAVPRAPRGLSPVQVLALPLGLPARLRVSRG